MNSNSSIQVQARKKIELFRARSPAENSAGLKKPRQKNAFFITIKKWALPHHASMTQWMSGFTFCFLPQMKRANLLGSRLEDMVPFDG